MVRAQKEKWEEERRQMYKTDKEMEERGREIETKKEIITG
jgi:hypothetical protein